MKLQFLILLAHVAFGASQNSESVKQCFETRFERTRVLEFNEETISKARGLLWNPKGCGTPDKCFSEFLGTMKNSSIQDAPKLAKYLDKEFKWCFALLNRNTAGSV